MHTSDLSMFLGPPLNRAVAYWVDNKKNKTGIPQEIAEYWD
jgi:hypothetical protein